MFVAVVVLFLFVLTLDGKVSIPLLILASSIESERGAGCTERDEYTLINSIKPGPELILTGGLGRLLKQTVDSVRPITASG